MKHWINKNYRTLIVFAFLIPIITVAIVSISHVTQWYGISNPLTWAIYLSVGVEIAAMAALAAISANMGKNVYLPFIIVTIVQFIGNIFFAFQYINIEMETFKSWVELVSPLVQYIGVEPTDMVAHRRFLALIAGGFLPIISLSFLHMLVKFTEESRLEEIKEDNKVLTVKTENDTTEETKNDTTEVNISEFASELTKVKLDDEKLKKLEDVLKKYEQPLDDTNDEDENILDEEQEINEDYPMDDEDENLMSEEDIEHDDFYDIKDEVAVHKPNSEQSEEYWDTLRDDVLNEISEKEKEMQETPEIKTPEPTNVEKKNIKPNFIPNNRPSNFSKLTYGGR